MLTVVRQSYLKGPEDFEGADGAEVVVIICTNLTLANPNPN